MTNKQIPVWIDCDTGTDDSVAIMLAHALPELSVIGLSAVAGNSPLYNTFPNTRRVVHLLGADYPVYPGAERPLMREPHVAGKFHGENGLGDVELPLPDTAPESTFAWDALYATAKRMPGELRLVATGPLTNVAIALTKYPELKQLLHSIALMGGAAVGGNVTPAAEFNMTQMRRRSCSNLAYLSSCAVWMSPCRPNCALQTGMRWPPMATAAASWCENCSPVHGVQYRPSDSPALHSMIPALSCTLPTQNCSRAKWRASL